jgi:hypothetical protein
MTIRDSSCFRLLASEAGQKRRSQGAKNGAGCATVVRRSALEGTGNRVRPGGIFASGFLLLASRLKEPLPMERQVAFPTVGAAFPASCLGLGGRRRRPGSGCLSGRFASNLQTLHAPGVGRWGQRGRGGREISGGGGKRRRLERAAGWMLRARRWSRTSLSICEVGAGSGAGESKRVSAACAAAASARARTASRIGIG